MARIARDPQFGKLRAESALGRTRFGYREGNTGRLSAERSAAHAALWDGEYFDAAAAAPSLVTGEVAADELAIASYSGAGVTGCTVSVETNSDAPRRALLVSVGMNGSSGVNVTSITYGDVAMSSLIDYNFDDQRHRTYILVAPAGGANNLVIATNSACDLVVNAVGFYNVDPDIPYSSVNLDNDNTGSSGATLTSTPKGQPGGFAIAFCHLYSAAADPNPTSGGGQTRVVTSPATGSFGTQRMVADTENIVDWGAQSLAFTSVAGTYRMSVHGVVLHTAFNYVLGTPNGLTGGTWNDYDETTGEVRTGEGVDGLPDPYRVTGLAAWYAHRRTQISPFHVTSGYEYFFRLRYNLVNHNKVFFRVFAGGEGDSGFTYDVTWPIIEGQWGDAAVISDLVDEAVDNHRELKFKWTSNRGNASLEFGFGPGDTGYGKYLDIYTFEVQDVPFWAYEAGVSLTASAVVTGAPVVGAPAFGQRHGLTAAVVGAGAPAIGSPTLVQAHALAATGVTTAAPTTASPALAQRHGLSADGVATGAPAIATPALGSAYGITANDVVAGAPTIAAQALVQLHAFAASGIATPAPVLPTLSLAQRHVVAAATISTDAPVIATPGLGGGYSLTTNSLAAGAPTVATPSLAIASVFAATNIAAGAPALSSPGLAQRHTLTAVGIATAAPVIAAPGLGNTYNFTASAIAGGVPALGASTLAQAHVLAATAIGSGQPVVPALALAQRHGLVAAGIAIGSPVVGVPVMAAAHGIVANALTLGAPVTLSPAFTQAHGLLSATFGPAAPALGAGVFWQAHGFVAGQLVTGAPIASPAAITINVVVAPNGITSGAPGIGIPSFGQLHVLDAVAISAPPPTLGSPVATVTIPLSGRRRWIIGAQSRVSAVSAQNRRLRVGAQSRRSAA